MPKIGERLAAIIRSKLTYIPFNHAGTRQVEESVELALSFGATASEILVSVADALHNEAKKAKCYPSSLNSGDHTENDNQYERMIELSDMLIQLKYLAHISDIEWKAIKEEAENKIKVLELMHSRGEMTIYPTGKIYRHKRD